MNKLECQCSVTSYCPMDTCVVFLLLGVAEYVYVRIVHRIRHFYTILSPPRILILQIYV